MSDSSSEPLLRLASEFVRHRNCLWVAGDFTPLFLRLEQHWQRHLGQVDSAIGGPFREYLAGFVLHGVHLPRHCVYSWTIYLQEPRLNLFFAGDTGLGHATGRFFTEHVKEGDSNEFYQDLKRPGQELHRSIVDFQEPAAKEGIERFYHQSEQRPAKFVHLGGHRYGLLSAHPDWDEDWFHSVEAGQLAGVGEDGKEELGAIESREIGWYCGCSHGKILEVLAPVMKQDGEGLFGEESVISVHCPRCAAEYRISREAMEHQIS